MAVMGAGLNNDRHVQFAKLGGNKVYRCLKSFCKYYTAGRGALDSLVENNCFRQLFAAAARERVGLNARGGEYLVGMRYKV